jgi:capsular exopolysaccharide synthesis family protein
VSKIYEALKKAEQERSQSRLTRFRSAPAVAPVRPPEQIAVAEEEYQKLRANLLTALGPSAMRTILITAPRHREGATTVALGLATTLAKDRDARVLLVEANLRSPVLERTLPAVSEAGLIDYLQGRQPVESIVSRVDATNFSVVAAGHVSNGAAQAIDFELLGEMFARVRPEYDFVVVDSPPVNQYADASVLASKVDGVILVIEADRTPLAEAEAAKRQLERVGARILGVVLNRKRSYIPAFIESLL